MHGLPAPGRDGRQRHGEGGEVEEVWYHINLSWACGGVCAKKGRIVIAAPIFRSWIGDSFDYFAKWVWKQGGKIMEEYHEEKS
jgi:hypothetical protein